ncbi:hypothetical protein ACFSJ3_17645 [Corallincola platygyrae]|uniref:MFS transporter n=1 Tax=Corallincola platygyrae TaxID=1193278 RepID=A0ABW4XV87_9GAMM
MLTLIRWVFCLLSLAATALFVVDGALRANPTLPMAIYIAVIIWGIAGASCFARDWNIGAAYAFRPFMLSIPVGLGLCIWGFWTADHEPMRYSELPRLANAQPVLHDESYQLPDYQDQLKPQTYRPKLQAVPTQKQPAQKIISIVANDCDLNTDQQRWCRGFYFDSGARPEQELVAHVAKQPMLEIGPWPEDACPSYSVFDGKHKYGQVVNIRKGEVECGVAPAKHGQAPVQVCLQWYQYDCIVPGASAWAANDRDEAPDVSVQ